MPHVNRIARVVAVAAVAVLVQSLASGANAREPGLPGGVEVQARQELASGVEHLTLAGDELSAHVAVIEPGAPVALRAVVAGDQVGAPLERPSSMCARVDCIVAVNADYTLPGTEEPVGGVVRDGVVLRSPSSAHHQLMIGRDGSLAAGSMSMAGKVVTTDLREASIDGVNRPRREDEIVLYTPAHGSRTPTNRFGFELVVRPTDPGTGIRLGETTVARVTEASASPGAAAIPADGAVLSGHGKGEALLRDVWDRVSDGRATDRVLLRLEATPDAFQSVGGTPMLLDDGRPWYDDADTDFVQGSHPRTVVAWDGEGRTFLVTVDGRQPGHSRGLSIPELTRFVAGLGATDALNLDGGGSTVFVVGGEVVNRPSDQLVERDGEERITKVVQPGDEVLGNVERPRTTALALVPADAVDSTPADPLETAGLGVEVDEVPLPPPDDSDPASNPHRSLPALVVANSTAPPSSPVPFVAAAALGSSALTLFGVRLAGRRPGRSSRRGRIRSGEGRRGRRARQSTQRG